jgi:glycosyltransferase involved in cell wall biosynthesis
MGEKRADCIESLPEAGLMRVLINALQAGNRSGTGRYALELIRALPQLENAPDLRVLWPAGIDAPEGVPEESLLRRDAGALARIQMDQHGITRLRRELACDIVHYPANFGSLRPLPGCVVTVHDLSFLLHPEWYKPARAAYYRFMARRSLPHAARIITDSQATADDVACIFPIPPDRIDTIPLGVDARFRPAPEAAMREVRKRYDLPDAFLLYLGTIEPRKNLARLIDAWSACAEELPDLVIAGREGWKTRGIHAAAARSPYRHRIHFPGFTAARDLPALMSACEGFVWPSLFEGFGLPPLEAMACGAPVLASNTSSLPEVTGDAAILVNPDDTAAIAEGLRRLLKESDTRRARSRERAREFTWRKTARRTLAAYAKCMA